MRGDEGVGFIRGIAGQSGDVRQSFNISTSKEIIESQKEWSKRVKKMFELTFVSHR